MKFLASVLASIAFCLCAHADWITAPDYDSVTVLVPAQASDETAFTASEFVKYWEQATGHAPRVATKPGRGVNVYLGTDNLPSAWRKHFEANTPGECGVYLRTVPGAKHPSLIVAGGPEGGLLNAVYVFFERYMGVRWLTPSDTYVPPTPPTSLPEIDYQYTPPFEYRWTGNYIGHGEEEAQFSRAHHLRVAPIGANGHDFYELVPPDEYYETHPEYYSLYEGKRVAPKGKNWRDRAYHESHGDEWAQLCMTNPDVPEAIMKTLRKWIEERPEIDVWGVMQEDCFKPCQCDQCRAVEEAEGTPAAPMLVGLNRVAKLLAKEHPEKKIITYAYTWSRRPPKTLRAEPNVIIQLCSIECDASRPLTDPTSRENALFADEIVGWARACDTLYMYDYVPNYRAWFRPHPNLHVIQPNMKFFAEHNVKATFVSGCTEEKGEFTLLRSYLIAKALWDPTVDGEAVKQEFLRLYYQEAAPYISDYIDLVTDTANHKGAVVTCYDPGWWIDAEMVGKAGKLIDDAYAAAQSDTVRERVNLVRLSVQYAAMSCAPTVRVDGDRIILDRPPAPSIPEYLEALQQAGVKEVDESTWITHDIAGHFAHGFDEPRHQESTLIAMENDAYLVWVAPELKGTILRWRDKRTGTELLRGFQRYGAGPGTFQEWVNTPGVLEGPLADHYEVVSQHPRSITLRASTAKGLQIERTMTLGPGNGPFSVKVVLKNTSDAPIKANVKLHPEFNSLGSAIPEIWFGTKNAWTLMNEGIVPSEHSHGSFAHGEYVAVDKYTRMAYHIPQKKLTVTCAFEPQQVGGLLWYFDVSDPAQQVNLEVIPPGGVLEPGKQRLLEATFGVSATRPTE